MPYAQHFNTRETPQNQPIPGKQMIANSDGHFVFQVDDFDRLNRFLILGSEGGSYYAGERELTIDNANCVMRCIQADPARTVQTIVDVSVAGRAPKNDPAVFALAMCAGSGNLVATKAALAALPQVCRIGTHLFQFMEAVSGFRGWGPSLLKAIRAWYLQKDPEKLAIQVLKYKQRGKWSHGDVLKVAHPKPVTPEHQAILHYVSKGIVLGQAPKLLAACEELKTLGETKNVKRVLQLIGEHPQITWEMLPTEVLKSPDIWAALLPNLGITALVRNLGRMSAIGLLQPASAAAEVAVRKITDLEILKAGRMHPLNLLVALRTYQKGRGDKGSMTWAPVQRVVDALDEAFYMAFGLVEPTGKTMMLAIDVSGSMSAAISGMPISCREAAAAMAMVTARVEKNHFFTCFRNSLSSLNISPRQRLDDVLKEVYKHDFGSTNCAAPFQYALEKKLQVDAFAVYTDSETNAGNAAHAAQVLVQYRQKTGINAKLAVVGMVSNPFSIADPNDPGMLDVVGFDLATPQVMSGFFSK